tara:strand:- start:1664 stop:2470 length:807 start_codon:yes stop_codon:yes gene_type:complete
MNKKKLYISNLGWQHKDFSKVEKLISINNFAGIDLAPMAIWKDWNKIEKKSVKFFNYLSSKKISVNALQGVFYKKNFNLFKDYKFKMVDIINHMHLIIKLCKIFKCKKIIIGSSSFRKKNKLTFHEADIIFMKFLKKIQPILKKNKIYLCLETIPYQYNEDYLFEFSHLIKLVKKINCQWIKVNFDTSIYHFSRFNKKIFINNLRYIQNIQITERNFNFYTKPSKNNIYFSNIVKKNKNIKNISLEIIAKKTNILKLNSSIKKFSSIF